MRAARENALTAWAAYCCRMDHLETVGEAIDQATSRVGQLARAGQHDEALSLAHQALDDARDVDLASAMAGVLIAIGQLFYARRDGDRSENLENSISALSEALERTMDAGQAAGIMMDLALAHADRLRGDRRDNLERATELLREASSFGDVPPDALAMANTNLATVLLRREGGDRAQNAREALAAVELALKVRSPNRDAVDWAYSQLALGGAHEVLAELGLEDHRRALAAYDEVIARRDVIADQWLVGAAFMSQGLLHLERANAARSPEALVEAFGEGRLSEQWDTEEVLDAARAALERAVPLTRDAPDQTFAGRALAGLANVLARLGDDDQAVIVGEQALAVLRPEVSPNDCSKVASTVAGIYMGRREWQRAADTYRVATIANSLLFESRVRTSSREAEIRRVGNTARWAALALACSGAVDEAVMVLESGRARELRRRLRIERELAGHAEALPERLRTRYVEAAEAFLAAPIGPEGAEVAAAYQQIVGEIRAEPGFDRFAADDIAADVAAASETPWPLLYVNPTPVGTQLLFVESDAHGRVVTRARVLTELTAMDIYGVLSTGVDSGSPGPAPYLFGAGGGGRPLSDLEFQVSLDRLLAWLGPRLARPIRDLLLAVGAVGVTIVPCGPVAAAPLHAASWLEDGIARCLIDDLEVRYAPSASVAAAARRRAARPSAEHKTLVALGNPRGDLPAAVSEVHEIARSFSDDLAHVATERKATSAFLRTYGGQADCLHLACHASGGLFDRVDAKVSLAGGEEVSAFALSGLVPLAARVVVVSACQSGLSELAGLPDEVISVGTAMIAAGSACAIVSLWPVDDLATAILMVRVYDEMAQNDREPSSALRAAQIWLRDLTVDDEAAFLADHPLLRAEFRRRERSNEQKPASVRRFSHPDFWAPFVAVGA